MKKIEIAVLILAVILSVSMVVLTFYQTQAAQTLYEFGTDDACAVVVFKNYDKYGFINITGGSMNPTITSSNTVIVENITTFGVQNIIKGDIIVFQRGEESICHRVVVVNSNSFAVKGDANPVGDPQAVSFDDVKFVVVAIFR